MLLFRKNSGQSMVEFIIVTPVILMLLFGGLQFALLYRAKITLNYATFQAARAGAFSNANVTMMEYALARNLAALYTRKTTTGNDEGEIMWARETVRQEIIDGYLRVQVLNPTTEAFTQLKDVNITYDNVIPNDNLMYRDAQTSSGLTIQDANLLEIRVSYCHRLIVPYMDRVLTILMTQPESEACPNCTGLFTDTTTFEGTCLNNDRFPIHSHAIMRMQSPAMLSAVNSSISKGAAKTTPLTVTGFWTLSAAKQTPSKSP